MYNHLAVRNVNLLVIHILVSAIEINITGTPPSDKLPIFFLKPNLISVQARVSGGQITRVYVMIDRLSALGMREKTGTSLQVCLQISSWRYSVPVMFISMVSAHSRVGSCLAVNEFPNSHTAPNLYKQPNMNLPLACRSLRIILSLVAS